MPDRRRGAPVGDAPPDPHGAGRRDPLRSGSDTDRTVNFSDAVFAIAMTLLILEIKVPEVGSLHGDRAALEAALLAQVGPFVAFVLSFVLIGTVWLTHHRRFAGIERYDGTLQVLNLVLLFFVAFLPVPTALLFQDTAQSPWPWVLYAATVAGAFLALDALWWHAHRAGLLSDVVSEAAYRQGAHAAWPAWSVFLASVPLAFVLGAATPYLWLAIAPLMALAHRVPRRRAGRAGAPPTGSDPTG